jgi:hypothetical protein
MTQEQKDYIDSLSQYQMAGMWRFHKIGDPIFQDEAGQYFADRFKSLGGMTPEISKSLGWDN